MGDFERDTRVAGSGGGYVASRMEHDRAPVPDVPLPAALEGWSALPAKPS